MRTYENELSFNPDIPDRWKSFSFTINYKNNVLNIMINKETTTYELIRGDKIKFKHVNKKVILDKEKRSLILKNE